MTYIAFIAIAALIGIDQLIKVWATNNLIGQGSIQFIHFGETNIINLSYYENTGAAFSIFKDKTIFLILITSVFIIFGLWLLISKKIKHPLMISSVALISAGGIGNLIDRIFRGFVIDYIEIKLFNFAVFNFADCCVVIGAVLLIVFILFFDKSSKEEKKVIENEKV